MEPYHIWLCHFSQQSKTFPKKTKKKFQKACSPCSLKISNSILTWMLFSRIVNRRNKQLGIIDDSTHIQLWNSIGTMFSLFEGCFIIWFMFTFFKGYIVASLLPMFVDGLHGETLNTPHYNWTIMHHNWTQIDKSITKFKPKEKKKRLKCLKCICYFNHNVRSVKNMFFVIHDNISHQFLLLKLYVAKICSLCHCQYNHIYFLKKGLKWKYHTYKNDCGISKYKG